MSILGAVGNFIAEVFRCAHIKIVFRCIGCHSAAFGRSLVFPFFLLTFGFSSSCFSFSVFVPVGLDKRGRGLTITFARVLVRALVDGPGSPPTNTEDHTQLRSPCSHAHCGLVTATCVSPPETGQSPWARICSKNNCVYFGASTCQSAPFPLREAVHVDRKIGNSASSVMAVLRACCKPLFSALLGARRKIRSIRQVNIVRVCIMLADR